MINSFSGDYAFLSNFYPSRIEFPDGAGGTLVAKTAEHYFQCLKSPSDEECHGVLAADTPGQAKRLGKKCMLREGWDDIKFSIMLMVVRDKFQQNPDLAQKLIDTGNEFLVEGNNWGDTYWGVCDGKGMNMLGHILMKVREEHQKGVIKIGTKY